MTDDIFPVDRQVLGSAEDAITWVSESDLRDQEKGQLTTFVRRFLDLTFVKDQDGMLDGLEERDQVRFPEWFREIRTVLRFVEPPLQVRFDGFDHFTPRVDYIDEIWYSLELGYMSESQRPLFVGKAHAYPIGEWEETDRSFLAIDLEDVNDRRIFEFSSPDLRDNLSEGKDPNISVYPAFDSYASMLSHVVAVRMADEAAFESQ